MGDNETLTTKKGERLCFPTRIIPVVEINGDTVMWQELQKQVR